MIDGLRISLVIPCYNEEQGIGQVLSRVPSAVDEVVVVDNASTDGTARVAAEKGARVVSEPQQGYGRAHRTGFQAATGDVIAALDGDGTYPVEDVPELARRLQSEGLDFISACRFPMEQPDHMHRTNYLGNRVITWYTRAVYGLKLDDALSGMWVFRRAVLEQLELTSDDWNLSAEIKVEAACRPGIRFGEVHIPYGRRCGKSKLIPWRAGLIALWFLLERRLQLLLQRVGRAG